MDPAKTTFEIGIETPEKWLVQFGPFDSYAEAELYRTRYYIRTGDRLSPLEIRESPRIAV